jgi:nucleoside-diphosphate-sugar epimerase
VKCIVTGGSGFIGTHLVEELIKCHHEVLNIDIKPPNLNSHKACWSERNILDRQALIADFQRFNPVFVIHLAAKTDTLSNKIEDYISNIEGTENVLAAIKATSTIERTIITSTQFVNQDGRPPKGDLDFAPHTAYGRSKVMNEQATRAANLDGTWTLIRPTNIWGPWHPRYPHEFWRVLSKGMYLHPGGDKVVRSYGYVKNVIFQIVGILKATPALIDKKVYYLGDKPIDLLDWVNGFSVGLNGSKARTVPRLALRLLAHAGDILCALRINFPLTSSRFKSMTTSNDVPMDAIFNAFGQPPYSLQEGIDETVEWLRAYHPENSNGRDLH